MNRDRPEFELFGEEEESVIEALRKAAAEERSVLESASRLRTTPLEDATEEFLKREWKREPARPTTKLPARWLVAACLLLGVGAFVFFRPSAPPLVPSDQLLEPGGFVLGSDSSYHRIEWSHPSASGLTFVVHVSDPRNRDRPLAQSGHLDTMHWEIPANETSSWPDRIAVTVTGYDAGRQVLGSVQGYLQR